MKRYKEQLRGALERSRWELVEIIPPVAWWAAEHWRLRRREEGGRQIILSFLVDPHVQRPRGDTPLIAAVCASGELPRDQPTEAAGGAVAWLSMLKGKFAPKLADFVRRLDGARADVDRRSVADLLMDELGAHWLGEELGDVTATSFVEDRLPKLAAEAAGRLMHTVGQDRLPELRDLLRAVRADPRHPLVRRIETETQIEWSDDPDEWNVLQRLIDLLMQAL